MSASTTSYHNNNINTRGQQSNTNTNSTSSSSCLIPPDLRFPSYSTFSDQKAFLAVTGGDAPWFFPTRSAAMNNSRGFYTRFLENLGKTMTKYCQELEEYNNNEQNQIGGKAQGDDDHDEEDEGPPQLPQELRRLCAYVATSYTSQRLFENPEIKKELEDFFNDSRIQNNNELWKIFSASCPLLDGEQQQQSSNNNEKNQAPPTYSSTVTTAVTSTGRVSSAKLALLASKNQQQQQQGESTNNNNDASETSAPPPPPPPPQKKAGTLSLTSLKKKTTSTPADSATAVSSPPPPQQQETTTTTASSNNSTATNNNKNVQNTITLSKEHRGGDHMQWADATLESLAYALSAAASSSNSKSKTTTTSPTKLQEYSSLLLRVVNEMGYFISAHESWVNKNFNPDIAADNFWTFKSNLISDLLVKHNNSINSINNTNQDNSDDNNKNTNRDNDDDNGDDDDDQNFLQKRANAKASSTGMGGRSGTLISDSEDSNNPLLKNQIPRYFAPGTKPGIEICPSSSHRQNKQENENEKKGSNVDNDDQNNNNQQKQKQRSYWSAHQSILQGVLASNMRFQGFVFPVVARNGNREIQDLLYGSFVASSSSSSASEDENDNNKSRIQKLEELLEPLKRKISLVGNKRLFTDTQMNVNAVSQQEEVEQTKKEEENDKNNKKFSSRKYEPNIHLKVNGETIKTNKRLEWEELQMYCVILTQLYMHEMHDFCWALQKFTEIYEKAKIVSGFVFRSLRSYEFDVDNGRAAALVGDKMEEKTLLNKDFLRGAAAALMRQKPFLVWLGLDVVTDWITYCWVKWTSLEDDANEKVFAATADMIDDVTNEPIAPHALFQKRRIIRDEQRLRFVELARELKQEAEMRFGGGKNNTKQIPSVWIPVTSAELFCLDRREFPNSIQCPCISELDVAVVDVSSVLSSSSSSNSSSSCAFFQAPKVELVLEIKYSGSDLLKASNQEVVFARALAATIKEKDDTYRGFIRLGTTVKDSALAHPVLADLGHVAFGCDTLPDLALIRSVAEAAKAKSDKNNHRKHGGGAASSSTNPQDLIKSVKVPPKYSELLATTTKNSQQQQKESSLITSGFYLTMESFEDWAKDEAQTRFAATTVRPSAQEASIPRFFLVTTWPFDKDTNISCTSSDRVFPVYAPMKHVVVRQVASLLAKGGWKGVKDDPEVEEKFKKSLLDHQRKLNEDFDSDKTLLIGDHTRIDLVAAAEVLLSSSSADDGKNNNKQQNVSSPCLTCASPLFPPPPSTSQMIFFSENSTVSSSSSSSSSLFPHYDQIKKNYFTELLTRVICHQGLLYPKLKSKKVERDYKYRGLCAELRDLAKEISLDVPSPLSNAELSQRVYFPDYIAAVGTVSLMWGKLKKQKGFLTPLEIYQQQYLPRDNILFVRFDKAF